MNISPITPISKACEIYANTQDSFPQILEQAIHNTKHYIVPIKRNTHHLRVIIPALSSQAAYKLAKEEFECDSWTVDTNHQQYKTL